MMMRPLVALALLFAVTACDPVHADAIAALGGEAAGVRTGPLHRAGQPCLLCHDGSLGDPNPFSVAGTVFKFPFDLQALAGATVTLEDATGATRALTTNAAGNFYVTPSQYTPTFPLKISVSYKGKVTPMKTHAGRAGACATCHFDPAGQESPGHVYFVKTAPELP